MHTTYGQDRALLTPPRSWLAAAAGIGVVAWVPMMVDDDILIILGTGLVLAVGAIGLNLVMGYAGQVSLAHAFFVGIGAYTAAALSGDPEGRYIGLGVEFAPVWIIASGIVAGLCGAAVAPLASRLRGLYLAIVTLGLVFIGVYVFRSWTSLSGGINVGRDAAEPALLGEPLTVDGAFTAEQKLYWLFLAVLAISVLTAANIARSRIGRAFAAVRDRDIAAEVMGIPVPRYKTLAFALSAFYAGVAGSLLFAAHGHFSPEQFGLAMSIQFIAIVLIGGAGTISGTVMGAMFIALLPRLTSELPALTGFISASPTEHPNVFEVEQILYGVLIIGFLLFEPRGLHGIWQRTAAYWRNFPF